MPPHQRLASSRAPEIHPGPAPWQAGAGALLALALLSFTAIAETVVRFAPLPMEDPRVIYEQFRGLADYLGERAAIRVQWRNFTDYGELLAAFRNGEVDLTYLGPLPYVVLKREYPAAEALGCFRDPSGQTRYTCSLVTWGERELTPAEVSGLRIGLTQPYSTCGYLAVSEMLRTAGRRLDGDANQFVYAGSHSRAALGVVRGEYDVAGVKTTIAERYRHLNLRVIATSPHYPGFSLVANGATLSADLRTAIANALLELDPAGASGDHPAMATWGSPVRNGAAPPDQCDYSGIATALQRLPWPIPGTPP